MSNPFTDERAVIVGKLAAAGIPATDSPRAALPCVLVELPEPDTFAGSVGIGGWAATYAVQIMVAPPGDGDAAVWLLDQLTAVLQVFPGGWRDTVKRNVTHGGDDVPAYIVPVSVSVPNPNC